MLRKSETFHLSAPLRYALALRQIGKEIFVFVSPRVAHRRFAFGASPWANIRSPLTGFVFYTLGILQPRKLFSGQAEVVRWYQPDVPNHLFRILLVPCSLILVQLAASS
jgi:hypothetical protein